MFKKISSFPDVTVFEPMRKIKSGKVVEAPSSVCVLPSTFGGATNER